MSEEAGGQSVVSRWGAGEEGRKGTLVLMQYITLLADPDDARCCCTVVHTPLLLINLIVD